MPPLSRRNHATRVRTLIRRRHEHVRSMLAKRSMRCHDDCPGWVPGTDGVERCDDCASLNGYDNDITDADVEALPEVRKATRALYSRAK